MGSLAIRPSIAQFVVYYIDEQPFMPLRSTILFSIFCLILSSNSLVGQLCVDYGEFDDPECNNCAPTDWSPGIFGPEIENPSFGCSGAGASPSGGTFVALHSNGSTDEWIYTTVSGLTPGLTYAIVFWYISDNCGPNSCCGELHVTADGTLFEFGETDEWTLAEICIEATNTSMDLELSSALGGPANNAYVFIDDADCSEAAGSCCSLIVELPDDNELCPNQDWLVDGEILGETGTVDIEWTSDPPEGVDYLDDPTTIDPTFVYPSTDPEFEGITFLFEVMVTDDECDSYHELEIIVSPHNIPEFDLEEVYCETFGEIPFPTVSENGFSGNWQTEINTEDWSNQTVSNLFTPTQWQEGCPVEVAFEFEIEPYVVPEFTFPLEFCRSQVDVFELPTYSFNDIDGEWNVRELILSDYNDGTVTLYFTPDDLFCSEEVIVEVEIISGDRLTFDLPDVFCTDAEPFFLPDVSEDGVQGVWSMPVLDFSTLAGTHTVSFIPMDEDCYQTYDYSFTVTETTPLTFDIGQLICRTGGTVSLDSFTLEGYQGYWSIAEFDPDTITGNSFMSTWTPLAGQGSCIVDTTLAFNISDAVEAVFDIPTELCVDDDIFELPTESIDQTINGTWVPSEINPVENGPGLFTAMFTPHDSLCALTVVAEIEITDLLIPEFDNIAQLCELDAPIALSPVSDNGIVGTWSPSEINPAGLGGQNIMAEFIPLDNGTCSGPLLINLGIDQADTPLFDLPEYICWTDDNLIPESISLNNIEGSWNIDTIKIEEWLGSTVSLEFRPNEEICATSYIHEVFVIDDFELDVVSFNPSSCSDADGKIEITGELNDLEFSIDAGISWQVESCFENLNGGSYTIRIRSLLNTECTQELTTDLEAPGAPEIISIMAIDESGCSAQDGIIEIIAQGSNLEYSIDGGVSWSTNNIFENQNPGSYVVWVRESGTVDCVSQGSADIELFPLTMLVDLIGVNVSDCLEDDGSIEIMAEGTNLEYSINNGTDWTDNSLFDGLTSGVYDILVRSKDDPDCVEGGFVELFEPEAPSIVSVETTDPGQCRPASGVISIEATGEDLEYSIDGGINWQTNNLFTGRPQGDYEILVRERAYPNCIDSENTSLIEVEESLEGVEVSVIPISACDMEDGQIIIDYAGSGIELSYDMGDNWQTDLTIGDLAPGSYTVIVRHIINVDCQIQFDLLIESVDCPCGALETEYNITPMYCVDITNGSIELLSIEGVIEDEFEVFWDNGESGLAIYDLSGGWYAYTILYDDDCEWRDSVYVEQIDPLNFALTTFDPDCPGAGNGTIEVTEISGGNGNYTYSLDGIEYQFSNAFVNLTASEYQVFVLDDQGCLQSQFVSLQADEVLEIDLPQVMTIEQGETVFLNPLINESSIDSFEWNYVSSILNPGELIAEVAPDETTSYTLSIFYGLCVEIRIVTVEVIKSDELYIPNIFSGSQNDLDGTMFIQAKSDSDVIVHDFSIYDRWGNLVFTKEDVELNNPNDGWDGYYNNESVVPGVYVYRINYVQNGEQKTRAGTVTLVR